MLEEALKLEKTRIYLTGATGWLGHYVARTLRIGPPDDAIPEFTAGFELVSLVPPGDNIKPLQDIGAKVVIGDIRDETACKEFLHDAQGGILLHLAGIIHPRRAHDFVDINTMGTFNLHNIACQTGVRRMVVMSSNSPIGCNPTPYHVFTEESQFNPYMGYGRSKHLMELELRKHMAEDDGTQIVIIRAPWFYGPYQPFRQTKFFSMIKAGRFPIVGSGNNRRSMAYIGNLTLGILCAAFHERASGETYWIADERPYTMNEIIETVQTVMREDFGMETAKGTIKVPSFLSEIALVLDKVIQGVGFYNQEIIFATGSRRILNPLPITKPKDRIINGTFQGDSAISKCSL